MEIPGFKLYRKDTINNKKGGGVALDVTNELQSVECNDLNSKKCEAVVYGVRYYFNKNEFLIVGVCYRSQEADENELSQLFESIRQAANFNCPLLIMGDFNYPDINWETLQSGPNGKDFIKLVLDCYLEQHVCEPTRLNNILDLVFTAELNVKNNITILPPINNSDHNVLTWQLDCSGTHVTDNEMRLCFNPAGYDGMHAVVKSQLGLTTVLLTVKCLQVLCGNISMILCKWQ